jgi:hypothetical protein
MTKQVIETECGVELTRRTYRSGEQFWAVESTLGVLLCDSEPEAREAFAARVAWYRDTIWHSVAFGLFA